MKLGLILLALSWVVSCSHVEEMHHKHQDMVGKHHAKMWKKMDANSDGKLSKEEFVKAHEIEFPKIDTNSDGFITQEEMAAHHAEMGGMMNKKMKHMKKKKKKKKRSHAKKKMQHIEGKAKAAGEEAKAVVK